jgi:hypothetical protein
VPGLRRRRCIEVLETGLHAEQTRAFGQHVPAADDDQFGGVSG